MDVNEQLLAAEQLYRDGQYKAAWGAGIKLLEAQQGGWRAWLLVAKATLLMVASDEDASTKESVLKAVECAFNTTDDAAETFEIINQMEQAFLQWKYVHVKRALDHVEETGDFGQDDLNAVMHQPMHLWFWWKGFRAMARQAVEWIAKQDGRSADDLYEAYANEYEAAPGTDMKSLVFQSAQRLEERLKRFFEKAKEGTPEAVERVMTMTIDKYYSVDVMYSISIEKDPEEDAIPDTVLRLKARAAFQQYFLDTMVYPNGAPISLFQGSGREADIAKLNTLYQQILAYEPSFQVPALPRVSATVSDIPQAADTADTAPQKASGGCYVATAVYGSYDCPQVWTLRRFRDDVLAGSWYGRAFIRTYYAVSPTLVKWFGHAAWFRRLWRPALDRMVRRLNDDGVADTAYQDRDW